MSDTLRNRLLTAHEWDDDCPEKALCLEAADAVEELAGTLRRATANGHAALWQRTVLVGRGKEVHCDCGHEYALRILSKHGGK